MIFLWLYLPLGLVVGIAMALLFADHEGFTSRSDWDDWLMVFFIFLISTVVWPLVLAGFLVRRAVLFLLNKIESRNSIDN